MKTFTLIILVTGILAGLIGVVSGLKLRSPDPDSPATVLARKHILRGLYLVVIASISLGLLLAGVATGVEILIAASIVLALFEVTGLNAKPKH